MAFPISGKWTGKVEYNYLDLGPAGFTFPGQRVEPKIHLLKVGLNYRIWDAAPWPGSGAAVAGAASVPETSNFNIHGQTTFIEQAYPRFRSPYQGEHSLPGGGQGRGILQLPRDGAEELAQQEDEEGVAKERRHDEWSKGIDPSEFAEDHKLRDHDHGVGQHQRREGQVEEQFLAPGLETREGIGHQRVRQKLADRAAEGDEHRVPEEVHKRQESERGGIVIPLRRPRNPHGRKGEDGVVLLQRGCHHPEQGHEHRKTARHEHHIGQDTRQHARPGQP